MKDDLKVSFIVPGYKCDEYIDRNILSIFDQDYKNYEIVVVLNGEWNTRKDLLQSLKEKYGDKINLHWLPDGHLGRANNFGFEHSTGDIISHLSSDLYLVPGALRNWIDEFHEHPEAGMVYSGYKFVSNNPLEIYYSNEFDRYHLECENYIDGANPVRRVNWKPFSRDLKSLLDWDWALSVTEDGVKAHYIKEPLYYAEFPKQGGLSYDSDINWIRRRSDIQALHGIPDRKICCTSTMDSKYALDIAKQCGFDFRTYPGHKKHEYSLIYCYGFMCDLDSIQISTGIFHNHYGHKIVHWIGPDIKSLTNLRWMEVDYYTQMVLAKIQNNFCISNNDSKILERLHLTPEVVLPPIKLENYDTKLDTISVNDYGLLNEFKKAMPDMEFKHNDLSSKITIHFEDRIGEVLKSICYGNYVISNIYFPGTYFIQGFTNHAELRKMITHTIRTILKTKPGVNEEDVNYYKERIQSSYFKNKLEKIAEKKYSKYARLQDIGLDTKGVFSA